MADYIVLDDGSGKLLLEDGSGLLLEAQTSFVAITAPVYPPDFNASITGQVVAGDGHLALGTPGVQFGTPQAINNYPVLGVASAQAFGAPSVRATVTRTVGSVASAQSFGAVRANVRLAGGGLSTAQAFGVPTTAYRITAPGVASAQAFGAPAVRLTTAVTVPGVPSAQSFGTIRTRFTVAADSVPSAQSFGTPKGSYRVRIGGVSTAQAFGAAAAWRVYLRTETCLEEDLEQLYCLETAAAPICGEHICGEVVAGKVIVVGGSVVFIHSQPTPTELTLAPSVASTSTLAGAAASDLDLTPTVPQ